MQKILILGAGIYQLPLIKKAKEMGLFTIVCSIRGHYPGFTLADRVYYVDTTDQDEILNIAKKEKIHGIVTTGTDVAVKTIGYVCNQLHLPGLSLESALLATDKYLMKEAFLHNGVSCAHHIRVTSSAEALRACENLGYPAMIKCTDSSGSRGISRVDSPAEVPGAITEAFKYTRKSYLLVEEYISGHEIGVDGFVGADSTQFFIVPHDKLIYNNGLTNIPVGHIFPYKCTEHLHACICTEVKKAVIALGLKNCFFNMDILVSASQAFVIELGARTGATCIPELLSKYCGFDFYEKILLVSLGYQTSFSFSGSGYCAAKLLCASYSGKITSISTPDISNYENCEISLDYSVGESVLKFMNGSNRIGHIIACAPNLSLVLEKLSLLEEQVHIEISQ